MFLEMQQINFKLESFVDKELGLLQSPYSSHDLYYKWPL